MGGSWRAWLKGTGIGCAAVLGVVVLALAAGTIFVNVHGSRDMAALKELDRAHPAVAAYTPPGDGRIAADRLAKFIAVRQRLAAHCADLAVASSSFKRMENYSKVQDEPDFGRFFSDTGGALKGMFAMASRVGKYLDLRNRTLLAEGMGLGEYTWIHVVAYQGWLREPPQSFALARAGEPRVFQDRVVPQVREMIRRHLTEREGAGAAAGELSPWRAELAALDADPERVPFTDGVPREIAESLAPFRAQVQALSCPATCELDLTITTRQGIGFEHI